MTSIPDQNAKPQLTSAEYASLWTNYMNLSLSERIFEHFSLHVDIPQVADLIQEAIAVVNKYLSSAVNILEEAALPIPIGFNANDVNPKAPRLFDDEYYIQNIMNFSQLGMTEFAAAISTAARSDVYDLFTETMMATNKLHKQAVETALEMGIYVRAPIVPFPYKRDYVDGQDFLSPGLFGKQKRPLLAPEISYLHLNSIHNLIGNLTLTAFSQVVKDDEVRAFFTKGVKLAEKQIQSYSELLREFQIPIPSFPNSFVTDSNLISPYSDKLMLYEAIGMTAIGLAAIGQSSIHTLRMDVQTIYTKYVAEIAAYSKEGTELMIDKGWMEQPPEVADRKALANEERKGE